MALNPVRRYHVIKSEIDWLSTMPDKFQIWDESEGKFIGKKRVYTKKLHIEADRLNAEHEAYLRSIENLIEKPLPINDTKLNIWKTS